MSNASALPLYVRISESLIRDIQAGRLIAGERLAPERDMAAVLGTSVGTLRKALADLEEKGLLERRQGSGNYIREASGITGVYGFFRLERLGGGGMPTAEVLSVTRMAKDDRMPEFGDPEGHRIRRLRRLDGVPVALEEIWLDGSVADDLEAADISDSLYFHYRTALGLWISRAEDRVGVDRTPDWSPDSFPIRPDTPCGYVERLAQDQDGKTVEFSRTWFDHDNCRYVSRLR